MTTHPTLPKPATTKSITTAYINANLVIHSLQKLMASLHGEELDDITTKLEKLLKSNLF